MTEENKADKIINTEYGFVSFQEWLMHEARRLKRLHVKSQIRYSGEYVSLFVERLGV